MSKRFSRRLSTINRVIHPYDRCSHIHEVLNETIVQWKLIRGIKSYHLSCQNRSLNLFCFYDDDHLCLCYDFQQQRLANCFTFEHNMTFNCLDQKFCENDGECLQDHSSCPTRSICMCSPCFYGIQCQFRTSEFGLSLDNILSNVDLNHQPFIVKMDFGLKFFILLFVQMTMINNRSFLSIQCHSIDFILRIYTIIKGAHFSKKISKSTGKFVIIVLVICIVGTILFMIPFFDI